MLCRLAESVYLSLTQPPVRCGGGAEHIGHDELRPPGLRDDVDDEAPGRGQLIKADGGPWLEETAFNLGLFLAGDDRPRLAGEAVVEGGRVVEGAVAAGGRHGINGEVSDQVFGLIVPLFMRWEDVLRHT